jgi:ribosome maturation factor RimP
VDAEALIRPVVESAGLELVEVVFLRERGRRVLRITVDRHSGVDLDAIQETSEKISRRLDLEGFAAGPYELEVSSPGIERSLRTTEQFRRAIGVRVKVKTRSPVDGARVHEGWLRAADDRSIEIEIDGAARWIALAEVTSARTVADWSAELKRSRT